ncbi:MAG: DUF3429 domain-containing protein, partial [Burkholderiaceae bacterium]|nr:DUF3429 domain-containing protein [Burkholderiaceae bacterium]
RLAHQLGFAGLLPFLLLMLGVWFADVSWLGDFLRGQKAYAMVILSFLGGIHWGAAILCSTLSLRDTKKALIWSVTPSLIAWVATLSGELGIAILMGGFIEALVVDKRMFGRYGMPDWLIRLRQRLTVAVVILLAATVIGANLRGV